MSLLFIYLPISVIVWHNFLSLFFVHFVLFIFFLRKFWVLAVPIFRCTFYSVSFLKDSPKIFFSPKSIINTPAAQFLYPGLFWKERYFFHTGSFHALSELVLQQNKRLKHFSRRWVVAAHCKMLQCHSSISLRLAPTYGTSKPMDEQWVHA